MGLRKARMASASVAALRGYVMSRTVLNLPQADTAGLQAYIRPLKFVWLSTSDACVEGNVQFFYVR